MRAGIKDQWAWFLIIKCPLIVSPSGGASLRGAANRSGPGANGTTHLQSEVFGAHGAFGGMGGSGGTDRALCCW